MSDIEDFEGKLAETPLQRLFLSTNAVGGWIAIAVGIAAILEGMRLGLSTLSRMGSGYLPTMVGVVLIGLGAVLVVNAVRKGGTLASIPFSLPIILILVALGSFGVLLPLFGLVPSTIVLMLLSAFAITKRIGIGDIIYAIAVSAAAALVFIYGLGMVLPVARWPF